MEIVTKNPFDVMTKVKNAGAIFLGEYSSEPLGDYFAGPNHVLPTNGTAKFFSPLSVDDFIKKSSIISYSRNALEAILTDIEKFATAEHLTAHAMQNFLTYGRKNRFLYRPLLLPNHQFLKIKQYQFHLFFFLQLPV